MNTNPMTKIQLSQLYTFNVNPSDTYQYFKKPQRSADYVPRHKAFNRYWSHMLNAFSEYEVEFYLQTEISEPVTGESNHQRSRYHFHGYIQFPTVSSLRWFLSYGTVLLADTSTYKIDTINDPDHWYNYVHKQEFLQLANISTCGMDHDINEHRAKHSLKDIACIEGVEGVAEATPQPPTLYKIHYKRKNIYKQK